MRVASIQTCISPWENWNFNRFRYLEYLEYYTRQALAENPDFLIWSESATLERISWNYEKGTPDPFEREVLAIARRSGKPLLTGEIGVIEDGLNRRLYPQNSAVLINGDGEVAGTYPKINLVPFGEWFPYEKWLPFVKQIAVDMGGSNFVPGDRPILFDVGNRKMAALICYEGIFYSLCREYRNMGAEFFVNITNLQWTHTYCGPMQQFGASVFRAVENGIWFVSASNSGYTALIDPCGRVVRSIPRESRGYLIADMDFGLNRRTVYSRCGDVILYLAAAFLLVLCGGTAVSCRRRKK
jgi:apolipoprotein N-acyltransferase